MYNQHHRNIVYISKHSLLGSVQAWKWTLIDHVWESISKLVLCFVHSGVQYKLALTLLQVDTIFAGHIMYFQFMLMISRHSTALLIGFENNSLCSRFCDCWEVPTVYTHTSWELPRSHACTCNHAHNDKILIICLMSHLPVSKIDTIFLHALYMCEIQIALHDICTSSLSS